MKQFAKGKITDRINAVADPMYPAYIIRGGKKNLMIDAGINLMGPLYLKEIGDLLGGTEALDYLFLTHSHYDHLGAMPYLKRNIPGLAVGGSPIITDILKKDTVLIKMGYLSDLQRGMLPEIAGNEDVSIEAVAMDPALKDGDECDLGDCRCVVYETPGHTRDSLSFFVPEYGALFPGEAAGVPMGAEGREVHPEFLSSFDLYVVSLKKLINLRPEIICVGHGLVYCGDDAPKYLEDSLDATYRYRELLENYLKSCRGDVDRAIEHMTAKEYDEKGAMYQERSAYVINLTAQFREIARMKGAV